MNHLLKLLKFNSSSGIPSVSLAQIGKGLIKLSENIDLKSVLHVPKLACNLLSDRSSRKKIGSAKIIDGLYYFVGDFSSNKKAWGLSSGENEVMEENFWDLSPNPLPNVILTPLPHPTVIPEIQSQEQCDKTNENNEENPSHMVPNITVSETGEESLQPGTKVPNTEPLVYTRRIPHQKNQSQSIPLGNDQSQPPELDLQISHVNDNEELERLKKRLAADFEIKDLGALKYFLGMEFARSKEGIFVNQRKYVLDLLSETGLLGYKPAETPIEPNLKLQPSKDEEVMNREQYQRLVGRLIYLSHTRPDIAFAVSMVSQFMHSPGREHFDAFYRILRYLKGTLGRGPLLKNRGHLQVEAYTDTDWAGSAIDRRSTSGYCTFVGVLHDRTKHVEVNKHFIKEKLEKGLICMLYIPTTEQVADVLTKGLPTRQFDRLIGKLIRRIKDIEVAQTCKDEDALKRPRYSGCMDIGLREVGRLGGILIHSKRKCHCMSAFSEKFSSAGNGTSDLDGRALSSVEGANQETLKTLEGIRKRVDDVCRILESCPWGPYLEKTISTFDEILQTDLDSELGAFFCCLFGYAGILIHSKRKCHCISAFCKKFSSSGNWTSDLDGRALSSVEGANQENLKTSEGIRKRVDDVCKILESCPWGPYLEKTLSTFDEIPQTDLVIRVLKRLKNVDQAVNYFRWAERKTNQAHCPEAYNSLLMVMCRGKKLYCLEQILEEMSLAGFGPSNSTCIELVVSCVKSQKMREAFDFIQSMRKLKFRPAFSAYTTLIGALSAVHEPDLMLVLFHQMQELGYEVNVHLFTTLIRVFAKEGRVDAALSLLDEMKRNSFDADLVLYNVCIDCFGKAGKVDMAWKFFHEMKVHGLMHDDVTYSSMIGVLWKANRLDEAVELFEQMELNRKVPCAYAYNTMIMGYGSAGKFDEAYNLLERQKIKGSIPSVIAYNCILTCLGKKGRVDEALRIFEEMKKDAVPNLSTYNILMDMLCKGGKLEAALEIRDAMKEAGLFPNVLTVNIMIDRLWKAQKLDEACSIFEGMDHKVCTPDAVTFCSLIEGLGRHGRVDDAYRLYERMLDSDRIPNAIVYTSLIRNFFKSGRKYDGHKIYKEMARRGISPDLTLLNTYMDCVFKAGETEKGRALFEEIKALGFVPDVRSYSILIHGLIKAGFARETYELFYVMKEQGCILDTLAYNTVIDGFCKSGKVNKAYQLLEEMKVKGHQPTVVTYGSVIDGLAKIDRLDEAYMLFEEAKSKGVELNVVVYSSLIDGFGKVGRIDEAYLIMEELMQKGLTPNVYTWNCLLDALVKAEEINEALVCFNSMKDLKKCTPNFITYSILINGLCKVRKFNKAFVFWQEMQKQGLKPNMITYTTMISGLAKAGNISEANGLFERFKENGGKPDAACYNTMIEGLSISNRAMEAYTLFEETRLRGRNVYTKTCVVLLDALHKAECLEQAAIVGAVLKETAKSQHASRSF
ncbi:pentatricopeptide repeat-containing protein At3g06920-like [Cornus florida]|uniref:pentatricopeptide repeat-containing protein At3g06920-like n=1 Tax=Cornus florida TaxID=4283 RepID=UPI00289D3CE0|nr:pentatricopeptide repeat-containing protein At3g06920-like [Cornus florida]